MLAERGDGPDTPIVERRQRMEAFAADSPEVPGITIEEGLLGLRQRLSAVPPRSRGNVLFLHGGAYVLGSARTHIKLAARYAAQSIWGFDLDERAVRIARALMVIAGDEDDNSIGPALFIKQVCINARLWICPSAGHTVNTEEPDLFNRNLLDFLTLVDGGRWKARDARSVVKAKP